jgi:hypothetical protein
MLLLALLPHKHFLSFPLGFNSLGGRKEELNVGFERKGVVE